MDPALLAWLQMQGYEMDTSGNVYDYQSGQMIFPVTNIGTPWDSSRYNNFDFNLPEYVPPEYGGAGGGGNTVLGQDEYSYDDIFGETDTGLEYYLDAPEESLPEYVGEDYGYDLTYFDYLLPSDQENVLLAESQNVLAGALADFNEGDVLTDAEMQDLNSKIYQDIVSKGISITPQKSQDLMNTALRNSGFTLGGGGGGAQKTTSAPVKPPTLSSTGSGAGASLDTTTILVAGGILAALLLLKGK